MGGRRIETCVARRHVDASRDCYFIFPERAAWGGRGCGAIIFILFSFPCSADHGRDWPPKRFDISPPVWDAQKNSISRAVPIDSNCRLPTAIALSSKANESDPKAKVSQGHVMQKIRKVVIPRSMAVETLSRWSWRASQHPAVQSPEVSLKNVPRILPVRRSLLALVRKKKTVVRDQLFPR